MFLRLKRSALLFLFIIPLALLFFAAGVYSWTLIKNGKAVAAQYQAVFLANGQVYFGHVEHRAAPYVTLTNIYYLQTRQPLQDPGGKKTDTPQEPELTLVKLGDELHGPTDRMEINRDQILFIEDLRDNGKVAEAIKGYATRSAK